ncbi:hypothetical protein Aperf_G00000025653 [Anoplocephala perfoliata]
MCLQNSMNEEFKSLRVDGDQNISIHLLKEGLWRRFPLHQMEMRVTSYANPLFPDLSISVDGLQPDAEYLIYMDLISPDAKQGSGVYIPPCLFQKGSVLASQGVDFKGAKIIHKKDPVRPNIMFVESQRHYNPRFHIVRLKTPTNSVGETQTESKVPLLEFIGTYMIIGTRFRVVTNYRNRDVALLKIQLNPSVPKKFKL